MLITTVQFCRLVDIGHDRFEQRRLRERAAADVRSTIADGENFAMPIAPTERGQQGSYDALDAIRMRCVVELERAGMGFGTACVFIRYAGTSAFLTHSEPADFLAARWLEPGGQVRHVAGTSRDLSMAMPAQPLAATTINVTAIAHDIARRARAQLGLVVRHGQFVEEPGQ